MTTTRRNLVPYYYVVLGVVLQGLSPVLTKLLLDHLSSATVVGARYALAVLVLLPFGAAGTRAAAVRVKPRPRDWAALFLVGALGSGVGALAFTSAIHLSSAGVANAISKTGPLFVAFFAFYTLRERITSMRLLLVMVMVAADLLIGAGEISAGGGLGLASTRLLGDALALLAGILRALSEVMAKSALRHFSASAVSLWRFGIGFLVTGAVSFATGGYRDLLALGLREWVLLVMLGVVATALSMSVYYRGAARIPAHVAVTLKLLGTVVTAILGWLVIGETLNILHVAGIGLIVSGGYLLVIRTAHVSPSPVAWERPRAARKGRPSVALRTRIAIFTSVVVVAAVSAFTLLSIRHITGVITQQTQLTMSRVATMMVQLAGLAEAPPRASIQQYMDRVVGSKIEGNLFTIDIVYAALLNERGNTLALSLNRRVMLVNARGERVRATNGDIGRDFLQLARAGELSRRYDIIPVTAQIVRDERPVLTVVMGCKRSIANRAIAEIAARMAALAFLVAGVGIAVSTSVVGKITRPLEAVARAISRVSTGERDVAVLAQGDQQSETIARALGIIVADLRSADDLHGELVRFAASEAIREGAGTEGGPQGEAVALITEVPAALLTGDDVVPGVRGFTEFFVTTVHGYDGALEGCHGGLLMAQWGGDGAEADDPLRATLAAQELESVLLEEGLHQLIVVGLLPVSASRIAQTADVRRVWESLGGTSAEAPARAQVIVSGEIAEAVRSFVAVAPLGDGRPGFRVLAPGDEMEIAGGAADA